MNQTEKIFLFSQNAKDERVLGQGFSGMIDVNGKPIKSGIASVLYRTESGEEIEATLVATNQEAAELHMLNNGDAIVVYRGNDVQQIGCIGIDGRVTPV